MVSITKTKSGFNTGGMPEKILSLTTYDRTLLTSIYISKENKLIIERAAANIVANYFNEVIDAKARSSYKTLHHVYEWDRVGDRNSRLFEKQVTPSPAGALISYKFNPSKTENNDGYIFKYKASVMESGETVLIKPIDRRALKFFWFKKENVFFAGATLVSNPGGDFVKGSFKKEFDYFMRYRAKTVLDQVKFWDRVSSALKTKRKQKVAKINYQQLTVRASVIEKAIADGQKDASIIVGEVWATSGD